MADEDKGEVLQIEEMSVNVKDIRIPWSFTHFALQHKESPGVIGKVFLRMLGFEDIKIDKKYESSCNLFHLEFAALMRECLEYQETKRSGRKKKMGPQQAQPTAAQGAYPAANYANYQQAQGYAQSQIPRTQYQNQEPEDAVLPY